MRDAAEPVVRAEFQPGGGGLQCGHQFRQCAEVARLLVPR
jgi:hypothetical protein